MKTKEILVTPEVIIPEVEEINLQAHDRETGVKAIVDKTNMNTLCVVPQDNHIVQHNHVIAEVNKLGNYVVHQTKMLKNGTMLMMELKEREPRQVELLPEDFLEVHAYVFNDYTKNKGMSVVGGGMRIACSNQIASLVKKESIPISAYGTADFSHELEAKINKSISVWSEKNVSEVMEKANNTKVSIKDVVSKLPHLPKKYHDEIMDKLEDVDTVYNIWNAYTQIITHEIGPKVQTIGFLNLQKRANKILELVKTV